jgi:chemotaxis protein methyltransferase CheR
MEFRTQSLGLAGGVTSIFCELIHARLGLRYDASQVDQIADRLAPLVVARGLASFLDYYYLLKYSDDPAEWGRVMDALAVPETYFWREIDQVRAVVDHVIPELVDRGGAQRIRIWSMPCASGEEPLTIAMMLAEQGWFDRAVIEIAASDASPAAVAKARAGTYGPRSFRTLPLTLREKYFQPAGNRAWTVSPDLQRRVTYDVVNLVDEAAVARHAAVPIVFCRNLFIYFSDESIRRAVETMANAMPDPGFLCLGASESLLRLATRFDLREIGGAFVYVKDQPVLSPRAFAAAVDGERN